MQITERWHRLPREPVGSPPWRSTQSHLDLVLGTLLWVSLLQQKLSQMEPSGLNHAVFPCCVCFAIIVLFAGMWTGMPAIHKSDINQQRHFCMSLRTIQCNNSQSWGPLLLAVEALMSKSWEQLEAQPAAVPGTGSVWCLSQLWAVHRGCVLQSLGCYCTEIRGNWGVTVLSRAMPGKHLISQSVSVLRGKKNYQLCLPLFNLVAIGDNCSVIERWVSVTAALIPQAFLLLQALEPDIYPAEWRRY